MSYKNIIQQLKTHHILGSENVARAGLKAFAEGRKKFKDQKKINQLADKIISSHLSQGLLHAVIKFYQNHHENFNQSEKSFDHYLKHSHEKIIDHGQKLIKEKSTIITLCYSKTVSDILIKAKQTGKNIQVCVMETSPAKTGQLMAKELSGAGIKVDYYPDSALPLAISQADLALIGCETIDQPGNIINKTGSLLLATLAKQKKIPVYVCAVSWKYNESSQFKMNQIIEPRDSKILWPNAPKNIKINNPAYEFIPAKLYNGLVSEFGLTSISKLKKHIAKTYPWLLNN